MTFFARKTVKCKNTLIIDGNNALHAIPELACELKQDRSRARDSSSSLT